MTRLILRWILLACSVVAASMVTKALGLDFNVDISTGASVFKLLVTGTDDAAVLPVVDRRTFKAATTGKRPA